MNAPIFLPYRLRLPGPIAVPSSVQNAIAGEVLNHRGPEFSEIVTKATALARPVLGTQNTIMFFPSSGTGMMEASLVNALGRGERALVIANGQFGERFAAIAIAHGIIADSIEVPWGENVCPQLVAEKLQKADYQAVIAVHNESSTGAVADLAALGKLVAETDAIFIVDSVSGLGAVEMKQDEWGIDILVSASQKALMCPPGLGLISVSDKAWARVEQDNDKSRFYWDLRSARTFAAKGQTSSTTPVTLMAGLLESLQLINNEGVDNVLARHTRFGRAMRAGGEALGLPVFTKAPLLSSSVSVFSMPELPDGNMLDGSTVVKHMREQYNTIIAGARNRLAGTVIRIGTMGQLTEDDIFTDLEYLEATLKSLGHTVTNGAGMEAARQSFKQDA